MKNKMLARRIAIAMLSAGMVMTTVPVSAFAADVVSVEASDANAYGGQSVTDNDFKTALTTAVTGLSGYTLTSKTAASALNADDDSIKAKINTAMTSTSYTITNLKIAGATAPTYQTTATGGALVMPVVTITADVYKDSTTAWGTCTFTLDATSLTKKEEITAAEAIVNGAGGKSGVDANADKYANEDNSSKLADYVDALLAASNTKIVVAGTSTAAGTKLGNIHVGTTADGTTKTAAVSQSAITPATKAAAGSEAVAVTFDIKLTKADNTDPDYVLASNDTTANSATPYIIDRYCTNHNARCVTSTKGYYDINLTGKTTYNVDSYTYQLPDSFRGIGSVGNFDSHYPTEKKDNNEGQDILEVFADRAKNEFCLKIDYFNGNGCSIDEDIYTFLMVPINSFHGFLFVLYILFIAYVYSTIIPVITSSIELNPGNSLYAIHVGKYMHQYIVKKRAMLFIHSICSSFNPIINNKNPLRKYISNNVF